MKNEAAMNLWAEIDINAIKNNLNIIRALINKRTKIMGVVKFDAYGHGAIDISRALVTNGIDALGVATVEEGIELRKNGVLVPIHILNKSMPEAAEEIVRYNLTPMVCNSSFAEELNRYSSIMQKKLGIQIRLDISNSNIGVKPEDLNQLLENMLSKKNLTICGIFTHLVSAYVGDKQSLEEELKWFKALVTGVKKKNVDNILIHAFSSPGIFNAPDTDFSMIRIGTSLYGLPSCTDQDMKGLKPIMQLKSRIADISRNKSKRHMEYTGFIKLKENTVTALVPVGYGHVPALSHIKEGFILVHGMKAPIIGGVFMGHMIIDITKIPNVKIGDQAVIFGKQHNQNITIQDMADRCGIAVERCESVCFLDKAVQRFYID